MSGYVAHPITTDPLRNFKFVFTISKINLPGIVQLGFMSVSGLSVSTPAINYREGGNNTTTKKMPGQSEFPPITCQRGVAVGSNIVWDWYRQIFSALQGGGIANGGDFRCDATLEVLDHPVTVGTSNVKARFNIYNMWPTSIQFSDFDAGGNALLMQNMSLEYEGFDFALAAADVAFI